MDIKELKLQIENGSIGSSGIIFVSKDTYVPKQYIYRIASLYNKDVEYVQSSSRLVKSNSLFSFNDRNNILVFITDRLDTEIILDEFSYIICNKCKNKDAISVPNLENWQILDYAISNSSSNIDRNKIKTLVDACNNDMYLLDNEINKYNIFTSNQNNIFNSLNDNFQFVKSFNESIFDFTNSILDKDLSKIVYFYNNLDKYNFDIMAIISIMYTQIRNIIVVGFNSNPTEENTGLSSKQIYWIRKNLYKYNRDQLIRLFTFISDVDYLIKDGLLSNKQALDYIIITFLQELLINE